MLLQLQRVSDRANQGVEALLSAMGISMAGIVLLQVVCRYLFNHSLFWSEELARYLLVWLTFLGATSAYRRGFHPGVDLVFERLSMRLQRRVLAGVHLISLLFFGLMVVKGTAFAWFVRLQITPALSLPKWTIMMVVPLAGILFILHGMCFFFQILAADPEGASPKASEHTTGNGSGS